MSINHHRSNLIKHKNTINNKVTVSYNHMHMPLYSFLYVVTKQTMYRPGIHIYHCVVVWPAPYENLIRRSPVYDPKVSCEFCEYKSMMVTTPLINPTWMHQHVRHLVISIHVKGIAFCISIGHSQLIHIINHMRILNKEHISRNSSFHQFVQMIISSTHI